MIGPKVSVFYDTLTEEEIITPYPSLAGDNYHRDWNKLSVPELKDFLDLVEPSSYAKCAENLFTYHSRDKNFHMTVPVEDLYIATNYSGIIPQKYDINQLQRLSKAKFGIIINRDRILPYLDALDEEGDAVLYTLIGGNYYQILNYWPLPEIKKLCDYGEYFAPICADDNFWNIVSYQQLIKFLTSYGIKDPLWDWYQLSKRIIEYFIEMGPTIGNW